MGVVIVIDYDRDRLVEEKGIDKRKCFWYTKNVIRNKDTQTG